MVAVIAVKIIVDVSHVLAVNALATHVRIATNRNAANAGAHAIREREPVNVIAPNAPVIQA